MSIIPYPEQLSKWNKAKKAAVEVGKTMIAAAEEANRKDIWIRGDRMKDCNNRLEYTYCQECGSMHIRKTNLCRDRLCPLCAWRLSLQRVGSMIQTMELLHQERQGLKAAMITLTIKNVPAIELNKSISKMLSGWDKLTKRRKYAHWIAGYARSIEITRSSKRGDYHPHIHALIIWADGYKNNITQRELAYDWAECCEIEDYTPIVDIRAAYGKTKSATAWDKLVAATVECCKYAIKGELTHDIANEDLISVADAIKGRRLISYAGCIRKARKKLNIQEENEATDISDTSIECPKCGATDCIILAYHWAEDSSVYRLAPHPYMV